MSPNDPQHPRFPIWQEYKLIRRECRIRRRAIILSRSVDSDIDPDHQGRRLYDARIKAAALRGAIYAKV